MSDDEEEHSLDRSHSSFRLLNGLTVFHFRDKIQPLFAASMVVLGGSFTDPVDFPGLNHLFEHMLFTGSKPFPGINEVISKNFYSYLFFKDYNCFPQI